MEIREKIGLRIKALRTERKLTQEAVAYLADVDRTFMNHVENGKRNISISTLEKITKGLNISLSEFFTDSLFKK